MDDRELEESYKGANPIASSGRRRSGTRALFRKVICAFANDLPNERRPGLLFVGVKDDGSPANLPVTDELLGTIVEIRSHGKVLPLPVMTIEKRHLLDADMAAVDSLRTLYPSAMKGARS